MSNRSSVIDAELALSLVKKFADATRLPFPLVYGGEDADWPNGTVLGKALGYLTRTFSSNPLLSSKVVPNYLDPEGSQPYYLFIGNVFPRQTLRPERNEESKVNEEASGSLLEKYANLIGRTIPKEQLSEEAKEIERLSSIIDAMLSKTAAGSVNFPTAFNPIRLVQADATFGEIINFTEFMFALTAASSNDVKDRVRGQGYNLSLNSVEYFADLKGLLREGNEHNIKPSTVYNYLYNWVLSQYSGLFLAPTTELPVGHEDAFNQCVASTAISSMPFASGRVYLDSVLPTKEARNDLRRKVERMTSGIIAAFQSMIADIDWMTDASKAKADDKLKNMVKNVAFPDFVEDDQLLAEYYRDFDIQSTKGNWELAQQELQRFTLQKQLDDLARGSVDRTRFAVSMNEVQAIYMPSLNSINIPLAFLQKPFFDIDWPASLNFGAIGATIGHEITHGFDTNGVKWDSIGRLAPWLDDESQKAFDKMASCVIGEYDKFCFLAQNVSQCLSGNATKAENIADNG
ncbi:Protein NEP-17 b, partial [Aphelenchoides avenae]